MLTVTDHARTYLKNVIDQSGLDDGAALRLVAREQGLGLAPDTEKPTDTAYTAGDGDETVLVVDEDLAGRLGDLTMDVQDTQDGPRLSIT